MLNSLIHSVVRYGTLSIAMVGGVMSAFADVSFSGVSASSAAPGVATVSATVTGTGDVFAEYAHAKKPQPARSVKSRYSQDGLIAMWDGEDNMGTGACSGRADMARSRGLPCGHDFHCVADDRSQLL